MYSLPWFTTFAASVPASAQEAELAGIAAFAPPDQYPRVLDVGCGTGRTAAGLVPLGYRVTGIDINPDALAMARKTVPAAEFVELDQRHLGRLGQTFDLALVLWNSLGFGTRDDDRELLRRLAHLLRQQGKLVLDLYHPGWLAVHRHAGTRDDRGATIDRWVEDGRCRHRIHYDAGGSDAIEFNVYSPDDMTGMLREAGFELHAATAWWNHALRPGEEHARYQLLCGKRPESTLPATDVSHGRPLPI